MATRRKLNERSPNSGAQTHGLPTQEDEADILDEVGGERDDGGELLVDEEKVRELGAVDAASVRENRRMERVANKKRGGEKGVVFNTDDLLTKYEGLIKEWPPNTLDISVKRLTGTTQPTSTIVSRPRSGAELYQAIKDVHGQYEEAQYEVKFLDTNQRVYRGTGRITMPDTRPAGQQGQPMHYPPNGAPPPGYQPQQVATSGYMQSAPPADPTAMMSQMFDLFQRMQATATGQAPQPFQMPAPSPQTPATDPMAMMSQMFEMFQRMQAKVPQPQFQAPQTASVFSPQGPPTDPMAMMSQMFEMFQRMQGQTVSAPPPAQPQFVAPPQPVPPPQPSVDPMEMMSKMFDMFQKMQANMSRNAEPGPSAFRRPPYYPQGEGGPPRYQGPPGPPQPPPRPPTMAEQFRESIGVVRSAMGVVQEMESMMPSREQESRATPEEDDDSPVRVIDTGPAKIVVNKSDGSTRLWETGIANMDKIFKWVGEQHEVVQKAHAAKQPQRRQLPPGYVEVGPDYQPPPGYRAVPVERDDLPPPPEHVPPPIQTPASRTAWGEPTTSEDEYTPGQEDQ